jgi:hypothetical protein
MNTSPHGMPSDSLLLVVALLLVAGSAGAFLLARGRQKARYLAMRRSGGHSQPLQAAKHPGVQGHVGHQGPSEVRATDLLRLTKEEEARRKNALKLIEGGKVREGALILEELGLQRYAISALEQARLIEDACAILMRMNRPNRAGVVFQRNGMPLKAAEHFLIANLPEEAARCYLEAGKKDSLCLQRAADIFEGLGKFAEALDAYSRHETLAGDYVRFCLNHACYEPLRDFMHDSKRTREGFAILDMYATKKLVKSLPLDTQTAQSLSLWCKTVKRVELIEMSLRKLSENKNLLSLFWSLLPEEFASQIVTSLLQAPHFKAPEGKPFLLQNARALHDAKRHALAALFYEETGRILMAAKCQAFSGDPGYALDLLHHADGDPHLARQLLSLLSPHTATPRARHARYSQDVVHAAIRILQSVDPDADELHTASPFSLIA